MTKQRELAKSTNELEISRQVAEQDYEIANLETNYYNIDNPELKRAEAFKPRELARRSNELALEKANADREAALAGARRNTLWEGR
jgi:hypothetical protein